jgi:hypothetical protein
MKTSRYPTDIEWRLACRLYAYKWPLHAPFDAIVLVEAHDGSLHTEMWTRPFRAPRRRQIGPIYWQPSWKSAQYRDVDEGDFKRFAVISLQLTSK